MYTDLLTNQNNYSMRVSSGHVSQAVYIVA